MKKIVALFTFFIAQFISYAQNWQKLDEYLNELDRQQQFMGSLQLTKNGKILYQKSIGFANVESKKKADSGTHYRVGSITKTFTATLVLKAIEQFKTNLDMPVKKYFPTLLNAEKITVRHLLQHRSGIANFTDSPEYTKWSTSPKNKMEMFEIINKGGSHFEPGTKFEYSNSNYYLLGMMLEIIYHRSFEQLLTNIIFLPLEMVHSRVGGNIDPYNNDAYSYSKQKTWKKESETDLSIASAAGAVVSTPEDLNIFSTALFTGKILNESSLGQMKTLTDNYGLGLIAIPFYDQISYGHNGSIDGFQSLMGYIEKDGLSLAITSNSSNAILVNNLAIATLSSYYNKPFDFKVINAVTLTEKELVPYVGNYSSQQMPLKINVFIKDKQLFAQATGQSAFPLTATGNGNFVFEQANINMVFNTQNNSMVLKQGGKEFLYQR